MKLVAVLLLSLAALAWADTSYQNFQTYEGQHGPSSFSSSSHDQTGLVSSNYHEQQAQPTRRVGGDLTSYLQQYLSPIRRQGLAGLSGNVLLLLFVVVVFTFLGVIFYSYYTAIFSASGRGLDTDDWEVDHSVWMDQLQKDFEDSWSQS